MLREASESRGISQKNAGIQNIGLTSFNLALCQEVLALSKYIDVAPRLLSGGEQVELTTHKLGLVSLRGSATRGSERLISRRVLTDRNGGGAVRKRAERGGNPLA
jgi:hypothetical protein